MIIIVFWLLEPEGRAGRNPVHTQPMGGNMWKLQK